MLFAGARDWLHTLVVVLLMRLSCSQQEQGHHIEFRSRSTSRHSRQNGSEHDCTFDTTVIFTDLFGASKKTPWLLCAAESAVGMLGGSSVAVLTDDLDNFNKIWPKELSNPGKLVSIPKCLEDTPLREWYDSPELASSYFRQQNIANAFRLAAVYKSDGMYLDLDIIPLNQALFDADLASISKQCEESKCGHEFFLNNAFLSFPVHDTFLKEVMQAFVAEYNGNIWGWNGPRLMSSLYKRLLCDTSEGLLDCHKLKILPHEQLAPFDWDEIMPVLGSQPDEAYPLLVDNPQILAIHAYHNVWGRTCIPQNSVFHNIMSDHCPIISATHEGSIYCKQHQ